MKQLMMFVSCRELEAKKALEDDRLQLQNSIELSLSQLQQKEGELSSWRVKVIFSIGCLCGTLLCLNCP